MTQASQWRRGCGKASQLQRLDPRRLVVDDATVDAGRFEQHRVRRGTRRLRRVEHNYSKLRPWLCPTKQMAASGIIVGMSGAVENTGALIEATSSAQAQPRPVKPSHCR